MNFDTRDHHRKTLDSLILTGNFIIAEIYRVTDLSPTDFSDPTSSPFNKLIVDFAYFENKSLLEKFIEQNESGSRLDESFYERFSKFLHAFSGLLNATCAFITDFCEYTEKAVFSLENTLDRRFAEINALKCEALYLFGVIVLLIENEFPGVVKERIFVALYRSGIEIPSKNFELMVSMLRKRKENYETCLSIFKISISFVEDALAFLNSSHMENNSSNDSEKTAAMLYICLYFKPSVLESDVTTMRQIADKFFATKWVFSLHLSLRVDIREKWASYKAAATALAPLIDAAASVRIATASLSYLKTTSLPTGLLSVKNLEQHARLIIDYNSQLRWLATHFDAVKTLIRSKKLSNLTQSYSQLTTDDLIAMLAKLSHFEHKLRESCRFLINRKADNAKRLKLRVISIFEQIIIFLASPASAEENHWNDKLRTWLISIKNCVVDVNLNDAVSSQILTHLQSKIKEVSDLYADEQVILRQYFSIIVDELTQLRNICSIDVDFMKRLNRRADATYLYLFIHRHLDSFESLLKSDALAIKFIFLKMSAAVANIIELVNDEAKRDILSTFYHKKLEAQLKKIIQMIPRAIFVGMDELQDVFPAKKVIHIQKTAIKDIADLGRRYRLAKKTAEVTKLSLGISEMCIKQLGNVEIRPRELLFDGLNQELDVRLRSIFRVSAPNVISALNAQTQKLRTFRRVFLFICEYIGVNGARIWQQCLTRFCEEMFADARTRHLNTKQLISAISPSMREKKASQVVVRRHIVETLVEQILTMSNPRTTTYEPLNNDWWSATKRLSFSSEVFAVVENWIPGTALCNLRQIILQSLADLIAKFRNEIHRTSLKFAANAQSVTVTRAVHTVVSSADFQVHNTVLSNILLRIGQMTVLKNCLHRAIDQQIKTSMEDITDASRNFYNVLITLHRRVDLSGNEQPIKISEELYDYFLNISEQLLNVDETKNVYAVCVVLLAIVVAIYSTNVKKSETFDTTILFYGLATIFTTMTVWRNLSILSKFHFQDEKFISTTKHIICLKR